MDKKSFIIYGSALAVLILVSQVGKPKLSTYKPPIPVKYGCNYVKLINTDDEIRQYLFKMRDQYIDQYVKKYPFNMDNINLINLTGFILDRLNKECFILYTDRQLSKEQALLLYTFLSYMGIYSSMFETYAKGKEITQNELNMFYDMKTQELRKYLNINMESDEKYQKIIQILNKDREYYIM